MFIWRWEKLKDLVFSGGLNSMSTLLVQRTPSFGEVLLQLILTSGQLWTLDPFQRSNYDRRLPWNIDLSQLLRNVMNPTSFSSSWCGKISERSSLNWIPSFLRKSGFLRFIPSYNRHSWDRIFFVSFPLSCLCPSTSLKHFIFFHFDLSSSYTDFHLWLYL